MPPIRSFYLVTAVLLLSAVSIVLIELRAARAVSPPLYLGWIIALLNLMASVAGFWTTHRLAWGVYLAASIAAFILIGASTALSGLWLLGFFLR